MIQHSKISNKKIQNIMSSTKPIQRNTQKYLNLNNKIDKTIEYCKNPQIPRTNKKNQRILQNNTAPPHKKNIFNYKHFSSLRFY